MQYKQYIKNKNSEEKTIEPFLNICRNPLGNTLYSFAAVSLIVFLIMLSIYALFKDDMDFDGKFYVSLAVLISFIGFILSAFYGTKMC